MPTHLLLCFCECGLSLFAELASKMLDVIKYAIAVVIAVVLVCQVTQWMSVDVCNSKVDVEIRKVEHECKLKIAIMEERENRLMQENNHLKELNKISSKSVTECQERLWASQQRDHSHMDCAAEIVAYRNKYEECKDELGKQQMEHQKELHATQQKHMKEQNDAWKENSEIKEHRIQELAECKDELGKQQVEHLETLHETQQKHMKDQHDAWEENSEIKDHQIQELQRQRREHLIQDKLSEATHQQLESLKTKILMMAEKKCKGWFGTDSGDLEVEQRELVKYASSLEILNGLDVDGGLRLLFKDPCSVDITMIDLLVTLWKTKTNHRKYQGIIDSVIESRAPRLT